MKKGRDLVDTEYVNGMFYGNFGTGKTTLVCTAAEHAATRNAGVLAIDIEGGIKKRLWKDRPNLTVMRPEVFKDYNDIYNKLAAHLEQIGKIKNSWDNATSLEQISKKLLDIEAWFTGDSNVTEWKQYLHVITDSFSETQKSAMDYLVPQGSDLLTIKNPQIQDWGKNLNMIIFITTAFRNLPINAWFTAHEKDRTDDDGKVVKVIPKMSGKTLADDVCGYLDVVGYYTTKKKGPTDATRTMIFQPVGKYYNTAVKDRFDCLGAEMPDPDIPKIMKLINLDSDQTVYTYQQVADRIKELRGKS